MRKGNPIEHSDFVYEDLKVTIFDYMEYRFNEEGEIEYERSSITLKPQNVLGPGGLSTLESYMLADDNFLLPDEDSGTAKPTSIFNIQFRYKGKLISYRDLPFTNVCIDFLNNITRYDHDPEGCWERKFGRTGVNNNA